MDLRMDVSSAPENVLRTLREFLRLQSLATTTSSSDEIREEAPESTSPRERKFECIGRGTFGVAYCIPGTSLAIKKTLQCRPALRKEFKLGQEMRLASNHAVQYLQVAEEFQGLQVPFVPLYHEIHCIDETEPAKGTWWVKNGDRFPHSQGDEKAGGVFIFERILPVPKQIRESLIRRYFDPRVQEAAFKDPENRDCILRPYLGYRTSELDEKARKFDTEGNLPLYLNLTRRDTLRNFPLYLDELEELHMDPHLIARDMALGLATAHWIADVDMTDVEFVISTSTAASTPPEASPAPSPPLRKDETQRSTLAPSPLHPLLGTPYFRNRAIHLWMFDFDKANKFTWDSNRSDRENAIHLVSATCANDPYYPNAIPATKADYELFATFSRTYILAGQTLIRARAREGSIVQATVDRMVSRPAEVMRQWAVQERHAMEPEKFARRKERARMERWFE